jgi:hypothetical protein
MLLASALDRQIFSEQNRARVDPQSYVVTLTNKLKSHKDFLIRDSEEGSFAVFDAIADLELQKPVEPL